MTFLAQSPLDTTTVVPDIAWSSFAPELPPTAVALLLLLVAVAGRRRPMLIGAPSALLGVLLGGWLIASDHVVGGAVASILGIATLALTVVMPGRPTLINAWLASLSLLGALALTVAPHLEILAGLEGQISATGALQGSVADDGIALFTRLTVYVSGLLVVPLGYGYLHERGIHRAEVEPLLLLSAVGMAALGTANDLITMFVALEVLSIALYVLAALARRDRRSQEAGLKYFVLGAVASAILLYGMALIYTATGTVDLPAIGTRLGLVTTPGLLAGIGVALITVGVGFKVALAPFHLWTPDVYQGSPTNITAFMAAATKAAGFAMILRLYLVAFPPLQDVWVPVLAVLAAVTMLYGAYLAVVQHDLKRMLAYSSITHAGYATIGVVAVSDAGLSGTLWYLLTYAVATVGAFGCVIAIERRRRGEVTLADLRGLGRSSPALAGILAVCLLSLAGIPATAGFVGKLMVFQAGIAAGLTWLVVIGVLSSVVAAFFYLKVAGTMFLEELPTAADAAGDGEVVASDEGAGDTRTLVDTRAPVGTSVGLSTSMAVSVALVIFLGLQPQALLQLADAAATLVR